MQPIHRLLLVAVPALALAGSAAAQDSAAAEGARRERRDPPRPSQVAVRDCSDIALRHLATFSADSAGQLALESVSDGRITSQAWVWRDTIPVMSYEIARGETDTVEVQVDPRSGRVSRPRRIYWDDETRRIREGCLISSAGLGAGAPPSDSLLDSTESRRDTTTQKRDFTQPSRPPSP